MIMKQLLVRLLTLMIMISIYNVKHCLEKMQNTSADRFKLKHTAERHQQLINIAGSAGFQH